MWVVMDSIHFSPQKRGYQRGYIDELLLRHYRPLLPIHLLLGLTISTDDLKIRVHIPDVFYHVDLVDTVSLG